jgi:hypothetical protein
MTANELRGYLTYPNDYGKPRPGSPEENAWCRGWTKAQAEDLQCRKSDYHLSLENDALYGRDSYAVQYRDEKNLEF